MLDCRKSGNRMLDCRTMETGMNSLYLVSGSNNLEIHKLVIRKSASHKVSDRCSQFQVLGMNKWVMRRSERDSSALCSLCRGLDTGMKGWRKPVNSSHKVSDRHMKAWYNRCPVSDKYRPGLHKTAKRRVCNK